MKNYSVFPDYQSTGIWDEHDGCVNIPDYVSLELKMLIQYWHDYWELSINNEFEHYDYFNPEQFLADGKIIVELLNSYKIDNYSLSLKEYENAI